MNLISLRLRKFKGILAGIGLEEIFIDFSLLPPGLIAISGDNGAGKTTLLDNCQPFRIMPSKLRDSKNWSPDAFSFYNECEGSDAMKDLIIEFQGKSYRSKILIDADKRKQEAYLYEQNGLDWMPLNDGKTATYDEAAERIFGSPTLFFTSIFQAQDARRLTSYTRSNIMSIIGELLAIDYIREQGEKAKKVADALKGHLAPVVTKLTDLQAEIATQETLSASLAGIRGQAEETERDIVISRLDLDTQQSAIIDKGKQQAAQESDRRRLQDLETVVAQDRQELLSIADSIAARRQAADEEIARVNRQCAADIQETEAERQTVEAEKTAKEQAHATATADINTMISRAEKIMTNGATIRAKVKEETETTERLAEARADLDRREREKAVAEEKVSLLNEVTQTITRAESDLQVLVSQSSAEVQRLETAIQNAEKDAERLENSECPVTNGPKTCKFLRDAEISKARLPQLREELAAKQQPDPVIEEHRQHIGKLKAEAAELVGSVEALEAVRKTVTETRGRITTLEATLADIARFTKLLPELEQAERNTAQYRKELAVRDREYGQAVHDINNRLTVLQAKCQRLECDKDERLAEIGKFLANDLMTWEDKRRAINERLAGRELDIITLQGTLSADLDAEIAALRDRVATLERSSADQQMKLQDLRTEERLLQEKLMAIDGKRAEASAVRLKIDRFNREIADFILLARACSNDGVIALELDDAAPGISSLTNELLLACYGPRFAVRLETQTRKADGSMKEDFDISVFDAETDTTTSFFDKSGGERTYIEDAIRRSFALYNMHNSRRHFATLYSDEKDGALSPQKRVEFMAIKRRAMELGGYSREFFISHTPELQDQADARVVLAKGGVTIQ